MRILPLIYLITGIATIFIGPLAGKAGDRFGKFPIFCFGSAVTLVMVPIWTNIGHVPLAWVIVLNVLLFAGIFSRIIPSQALVSAIPDPDKRGSFNAISASLQQFAGGVSAAVAGVWSLSSIRAARWSISIRLGYIVVAIAMVSVALMYFVQKQVREAASRI